MGTQKALDKITEWLSIATQMQSYLPTGDSVLAFWFAMLEDFKKDLPLLHKMASDALKVCCVGAPACICVFTVYCRQYTGIYLCIYCT